MKVNVFLQQRFSARSFETQSVFYYSLKKNTFESKALMIALVLSQFIIFETVQPVHQPVQPEKQQRLFID